MNADSLRAIQAPLKDRYRTQPDSAHITLHAQGRLGEGVSCSVETGQALVRAGLHPATGGNGLAACSGDMLLQALAACAGVTLNAVATALGITLRDALVRAEGDLDFRGTLGVAKDVPVGFQQNPPAVRARHRCIRRAARCAAAPHRTLLRRLPDLGTRTDAGGEPSRQRALALPDCNASNLTAARPWPAQPARCSRAPPPCP